MRAHRRDSTTGHAFSPLRRGVRVRRRALQSAAVGLLLLLGVCGCASSATARAGENPSRTANATPLASPVVPNETTAPHD